jgi:hypothetical protein
VRAIARGFEPIASTGSIVSVSPLRRRETGGASVELQEGNGRGDAVRLPARGFFEGCEPRRGNRVRRAIVGFGRRWGGERAKRGEPQGRQRDATSPHFTRMANRRGGAKPRGRHVFPGWLRETSGWRHPVDQAREGRRRGTRRIPREAATTTRRSRRAEPGQGGAGGSEGEAKTTRARQAGQPVGAIGVGTPRRPARQRANGREGAGKANDPLRCASQGAPERRSLNKTTASPMRKRRGGPHGP